MKKLQNKRWLKAVAWLLAVACAFGFAFTAGLALSIDGSSNDSRYETELNSYCDMAWRELELIQNPGTTEEEQRRNAQDLADLEEALEDSGFYFEIRNESTDEVLLSNLTDDSQRELLDHGWYKEEEPGEEALEETPDEEALCTAVNPVCYFMEDGILVPEYSYSDGSGGGTDAESAETSQLFVLGDEEMLHPVEAAFFDGENWLIDYDPEEMVSPYPYAVKVMSDGSNCCIEMMSGYYLSTPMTKENQAEILEALENGSVYLQIGESYYWSEAYEIDEDGTASLVCYLSFEEFLEQADSGALAGETPVAEGTGQRKELSDLAAVYFRLHTDGTLEQLNLLQTGDIQQALEEGTLYVLAGEEKLCRVVSWTQGESCTYDAADTLAADLTVESDSAADCVCYQRTEEGQLVPVEASGMIALLNLCYGNRLYILTDLGEPVRVTSCEQHEDGIYFEYQTYSAAPVTELAPDEEPPADLESAPAEETADPPVRYYMAYGVGTVAGVTTVFDRYQEESARMRGYLPKLVGFAIAFGLADLLAVVWLCIASGHRKGREGITLNWFDRIWLDLLLVCYFFAGCVALWLGDGVIFHRSWFFNAVGFDRGFLLRMGIAAAYCTLLEVGALWLLLTVIARIKARTLWKNLLIVRAINWLARKLAGLFRRLRFGDRLKKFFGLLRQNLNLAVKLGLVYAVFALVDFVCAEQYGMSLAVFALWFLLHLAALAVLEYWCLSFCAIRKGVERLNRGETEAQINTTGMPYDLRAVAEQLNNLSEGINRAVEKQMQSERFKSELITNVSHDLKTPLTSIINYIDLLKQTNITDPKALEYLEVLERKSQRLKKLTEDLVEASKASTGAMKVEKTVLDFGQLVTQALGEYDEKLQSAQLKTVYQPPEEPMLVLGDGRHLWRVLDNLLNNCVKYAMPGTRVYLSLSRAEDAVTLEMKNISAEPLNLTVEELMERFVRGDSSRSSDGSGLGLNIARNLTELQGGTFHLSIDGDLFKAIVTIPKA